MMQNFLTISFHVHIDIFVQVYMYNIDACGFLFVSAWNVGLFSVPVSYRTACNL